MARRIEAIGLLLQAPREPLFVPKVDHNNTVVRFVLPPSFYPSTDNSKAITKFIPGDAYEIRVADLIQKPDLSSFEAVVPKFKGFDSFIPKHRETSAVLVKLFMDAKDAEQLLSLAAFSRDQLNPMLFQYALRITLMHRKDTKHVPIPHVFHSFPEQFFDPDILALGRQSLFISEEPQDKTRKKTPTPVVIGHNYTANMADPEQRLSYFREDIGLNLHHWHWHLVYPHHLDFKKDRRGELFYYMHTQMLARYNIERFCNHMGYVRPLDLRAPIGEAYFPKVTSSGTLRTFPGRPANSMLQDLNRQGNEVRICDLEQWRDRIVEAIKVGYVKEHRMKLDPKTGQRVYTTDKVDLDEKTGIDILGNIVETHKDAKGNGYYGDLHNAGHDLISYCHDPDGTYREDNGVMGSVNTAIRDPVFFRWHTFIDKIFKFHKQQLPPYTEGELDFDGVRVESVSVETMSREANEIGTFWKQSTVNVMGLDFAHKSNKASFAFTHLEHDDFTYNIEVTNPYRETLMGTVRIFLGPKFNEHTTQLKFTQEQRELMIEMDRFAYKCKWNRY